MHLTEKLDPDPGRITVIRIYNPYPNLGAEKV
jgi:hypothetical protein